MHLAHWLDARTRRTLCILGLPFLLLPCLGAGEPFDYFRNSWQVIGLKDYPEGARLTPQNELLLAGQRKVTLLLGPDRLPLGRAPVKTLLEGWLPVVLLDRELGSVRYEVTYWATPLPTVSDWKGAFNWPSEGSNFLNWVRVKAVNRGATATVAQAACSLSAGGAPGPDRWSAPLAAGRSAEIVWRFPYVPVADPAALQKADPQRWLARTVNFWRGLLESGAQIEVPCQKANDTLKAAHVCQLIASDYGELHAGEGFYDEFYIRDGGYQVLELDEAGLREPARKGVEIYLRFQRPDGRFESQQGQLDANGQAIWTLWQHARITGDRDWLGKVYPAMRRAALWTIQTRKQAATNSPFPGLLPAAPADGEFLWDGKHHIVGYDFWNLRGLLCAADAARTLGKSDDVRDFEREAVEYRNDIEAAWKRLGVPHFPPSWEKAGTHWGNTETLWPTELFPPHDPRVGALLTEVRKRHGGGFVEGTLRWTGQPDVLHPYLSSYTTMASLIRGEHEKFAEEFYWYLLHSSASHAFPEGVYFKRRYAWSETIPHVLGAANFAFMLRHALIHERGSELHLLSGVPDWWLSEGKEIRVRNAPTHFGLVSFRVRGMADGVRVQLESPRRQPPARTVFHLPSARPALAMPRGVEVVARTPQSQRWDFAAVIELYQRQRGGRVARPIPGLVQMPRTPALSVSQCRMLDLAPVANTDPLSAPFGVPKPGKYLFTGLAAGVQTVAGIPFRLLDAQANQGRGLVVLQGAHASAGFPREVEWPCKAQGRRLYFLGNVHGYSPADEGAGEWGAVAEYVIHYADGKAQSVPLISQRTADDWAEAPDATEVQVGVSGDPWHLNVLGVELRPVPVERIVFRDLGTAAAPVLAAVTMEQ